MAKLKFDKETLQGFFFNHTEKIVLAVVLLLFALLVKSGSSLEGITKNPVELASQVDTVREDIEKSHWDNIQKKYTLSLDHLKRKDQGDAPTSESFYRLEKPIIGVVPNSATPRQDPQPFPVIDLEATVVTGALAFKARKDWVDPFVDLANMEQKKIEAPKKRPKKKKKTGAGSMYGEGMEGMLAGEGSEEGDESAYGPGMAALYGGMGVEGGTPGGATGPSVRADAKKFDGYRPNAVATPTGSSVIGRSVHVVSVRGLVPYQQQWDEFERVFSDAAGYMPSRDIPRYLEFRAERAEVPSDPNAPLTWKLITTTAHSLKMIPLFGFAGYPGELADEKYLSPGVLTMPVPPLMMRDLRGLALHSKVPVQEVTKAKTVERTGPELLDVNELGTAPDPDSLPAAPGVPKTGGMQPGMPGMPGMTGSGGGYGSGGEGMYGSGGGGMEGMYAGGMGGMSPQLARGPQAEFLMVRFFDYIQPGKRYVYRIQLVLEDPNHPLNPQMQPQDRNLADTVRVRLAKVAADEAKESAAKKTPIRLATISSEWSEPTAPVFVKLQPETYAGGVELPRMLDLPDPSGTQKSGFSVPLDGEPTAKVMSLTWNSTYAVDLPGIVPAPRGAYMGKTITANIIDPVTLTFKIIPDYRLWSGELVVDLRGGEVLEPPATADAKPLLTPGEVAVIDAAGNFVVRNELDDWQVFDKYAPPPPVVVESAPAASDGYEMDYGEGENPYGS